MKMIKITVMDNDRVVGTQHVDYEAFRNILNQGFMELCNEAFKKGFTVEIEVERED